MKFKSVIVATDYSGRTLDLCAYAAPIARAYSARLVLLHADEWSGWMHRNIRAVAAVAEEHLRVRSERQRRATAFLERLGLPFTVVTEPGPAREVIADHAGTAPDALVVIARRARKGEGFFMGSTTKRVLRRSPVPVLVIPGRSVPGETPQPKLWRYERLMATSDLSEASDLGLLASSSLAKQLGAELHVHHVVVLPPLPPGLPSKMDGIFKAADIADLRLRKRRELEQRLAQLGVTPRQALVTFEEDPATGIIDAAEEAGASLIVLPSTGRGAFERLMLGSTAERVARRAERPVMVMPPPWLTAHWGPDDA